MSNRAIFINYRREDSGGQARALLYALERAFPDQVFMDVKGLTPGVNYLEEIEHTVGSCRAVLVLIGKSWATIADASGRRRLKDPRDVVTLEISSAMKRPDVLVIPVLVGGAVLPSEEDLPESLQGLLSRHCLQLTEQDWDYNVSQLVEVLRRKLGSSGRRGKGRQGVLVGAAVLALAMLAGGGAFLLRGRGAPPAAGGASLPATAVAGGSGATRETMVAQTAPTTPPAAPQAPPPAPAQAASRAPAHAPTSAAPAPRATKAPATPMSTVAAAPSRPSPPPAPAPRKGPGKAGATPATVAATPAPASAPPSAAPADPRPADARLSFATADVLSFTQFMGSAEAKSRGRSLVGGARWTLTRDSLTCVPADAMPGFFPMTVRAIRDGDRVSFEGMRSAKAGDGYAYVRISGNLAPARSPPLLIVDLEFGRVSAPDGADPQPTFKSQARIELRPE